MTKPKQKNTPQAKKKHANTQYVLVIVLNVLYLCAFYWIYQHYS